MNEQEPLFEVIDTATYEAAQRVAPKTSKPRKGKEIDLSVRTYTLWYSLNHTMGFCTVPMHDEIVRSLDPTKQEYRQVYPVRMVYPIGDLLVCRDCFMMEADKHA